MKLLLDQNLSPRLIGRFSTSGTARLRRFWFWAVEPRHLFIGGEPEHAPSYSLNRLEGGMPKDREVTVDGRRLDLGARVPHPSLGASLHLLANESSVHRAFGWRGLGDVAAEGGRRSACGFMVGVAGSRCG